MPSSAWSVTGVQTCALVAALIRRGRSAGDPGKTRFALKRDGIAAKIRVGPKSKRVCRRRRNRTGKGSNMGLRVNTNIASINAQRNTATVTTRLARNFQRLSTGLRIATAADDAAGLAISERLRR